ncbi:MAG TPA: hypothetical protein VK992_00240, partial [Candidatus Caenarcaniphilales bacterium]|nr:hypothetical protein [Candidatus Caenarcaniphilales bacterium]
MEQEQQPDLVDQFLDFLSQLVMPDWAGLITLIPLLLIGLIVLYAAHTALQWRRAGRRIRSRVPRPLAAGAPPPGVHLPGPSRWPFVVPIGAALLLFALVLAPKDESGLATLPFNVPLMAAGLLVTVIAVGGWLADAMREWRATSVPSESVAGALAPGGHAVAVVSAHAAATPVAGTHHP